MSIELMRHIDYWIGIPLCFILTGISYISKLLPFRKKENPTPKKFLFIKLSEMGSIVLAYPLINKVRKEYPEAQIFFLTFEKNKSIFEILNIVPYQNILTVREKSPHLFMLDTLRVIRKIRNEKIDTVFDLELFSRSTAILTYLSKANKRAGFYHYNFEGLYRGNLLTHNIQYNPLVHISKSFLSLWQAIKTVRKFTPELDERIKDEEITLPRFISSKEAVEQIWNRLREFGADEEAKLFLINPGEGTLSLREWPLENFIALTKMLLEDSKNFVIIVGTQQAFEKAEILCDVLNNKRCINLSNETILSELLALFNMAEALITNDCGLAHLASLTSIRKFVLFGPESPQVYSPLGDKTWVIYSDLPCSPCLSALNHRSSACKDNKCLKTIKPDRVFRLLNERL